MFTDYLHSYELCCVYISYLYTTKHACVATYVLHTGYVSMCMHTFSLSIVMYTTMPVAKLLITAYNMHTCTQDSDSYSQQFIIYALSNGLHI